MDVEGIIGEMDRIYPEYCAEKYPHALDWYFSEWTIEHCGPEVYRELVEELRDIRLMPER